MRRLIREGNPPSGQLASPVPQYWNPSTEAFEDVLGAHGAPRAILYGPNGEPISQINPLPIEGKVQLTGRNAVLTKVFNAYQIRDTTYNHTQTVDISGYKRIDVYAQHTHDQPTKVRILPVSFLNYEAWNGTDFASNYWSVTMTLTSRRYVITSRFPEIRELASQNIIIQVLCDTAPTTGSVTVELVGIPN